ncbi:MAG: hypothetical protein II227_00435 [Clostridia bacterium]|nr:hypothetical protein [Clostridia bacterium]
MMKSNFDAELQNNSAPVNEYDTTDARIRELTAALAADVPAGFTSRVMGEIRAQRRRAAFRHRTLRFGSAAVAALVIIPMAAIMVPAMIRSEKNLDAIPGMQDSVLYDTVDEQPGDVLYRNPTVGDADSADASANGIMTTSAPAEEAPVPETESVPPSEPAAAPDHMSRENENPAGMGSSPETFAADTKYTMNVQTEPAAITVLRAVIGTERLDNWLAKEETEENPAKEIIRAFAVQREDFLTAAAALNLSFTQDELNELFYTPLTNE